MRATSIIFAVWILFVATAASAASKEFGAFTNILNNTNYDDFMVAQSLCAAPGGVFNGTTVGPHCAEHSHLTCGDNLNLRIWVADSSLYEAGSVLVKDPTSTTTIATFTWVSNADVATGFGDYVNVTSTVDNAPFHADYRLVQGGDDQAITRAKHEAHGCSLQHAARIADEILLCTNPAKFIANHKPFMFSPFDNDVVATNCDETYEVPVDTNCDGTREDTIVVDPDWAFTQGAVEADAMKDRWTAINFWPAVDETWVASEYHACCMDVADDCVGEAEEATLKCPVWDTAKPTGTEGNFAALIGDLADVDFRKYSVWSCVDKLLAWNENTDNAVIGCLYGTKDGWNYITEPGSGVYETAIGCGLDTNYVYDGPARPDGVESATSDNCQGVTSDIGDAAEVENPRTEDWGALLTLLYDETLAAFECMGHGPGDAIPWYVGHDASRTIEGDGLYLVARTPLVLDPLFLGQWTSEFKMYNAPVPVVDTDAVPLPTTGIVGVDFPVDGSYGSPLRLNVTSRLGNPLVTTKEWDIDTGWFCVSAPSDCATEATITQDSPPVDSSAEATINVNTAGSYVFQLCTAKTGATKICTNTPTVVFSDP